MHTIPNILGPSAIPSEKCRPTGSTPPRVPAAPQMPRVPRLRQWLQQVHFLAIHGTLNFWRTLTRAQNEAHVHTTLGRAAEGTTATAGT